MLLLMLLLSSKTAFALLPFGEVDMLMTSPFAPQCQSVKEQEDVANIELGKSPNSSDSC